MTTGAPVAHLGAESDKKATDDPCSDVLARLHRIVVKHAEAVISGSDHIAEALIQNSWYSYQPDHIYCLEVETLASVTLDDSVYVSREASHPTE